MSPSIYRADRTTHIKVVVVGLLSAVVVVIVGFTARLNDTSMAGTNGRIATDKVVTSTGSPAAVSSNLQNTIR